MTWPDATRAFVWAWILAAVAWDLVAFHCGGRQATISSVMYQFARQEPAFAVGVGVVMGHIFWANG